MKRIVGKARKRAMTLSELMVAMAVFSLIMAMTAVSISYYLRGYHRLMPDELSPDRVIHGLERASRLARSSRAVLWPPKEALQAGYRPRLDSEFKPLTLSLEGSEKEARTIGLTVDEKNRSLVLLEYPTPYTPESRPEKTRTLGGGADLVVRLDDSGTAPILVLEVGGGSGRIPWRTAVAFRAVFPEGSP